MKRGRTVQFSAFPTVVSIEYEKNNEQWYNFADYRTFKSRAERDSRQLILGQSSAGSEKENKSSGPLSAEIEIRGLEQLVDRNLAMERRRQKVRAIKAVLVAQQMIRDQKKRHSHVDVAKFIALVASKESKAARKLALLTAKADENMVQRNKQSKCRRFSSAAA